MVTFSIRDPRDLRTEEIHDLWRIRSELVGLRPDVDAEEDRRWFADHLRAASSVALLRKGGPVGAFYTMRALPRHARGRTFLWLSAEFAFARPALRSSLVMPLVHGLLLARSRLRHPGLPARFSAFCYLPSFLALSGGLSPLWILGEPGVPAEEAEWMRHVAETEGGADWDPLRKRLRMRTIPLGAPRAARHPETRSMQERYLRRNPEWSQGYGVLVGAACGLRTAAFTARDLVDRWVKR